MSLREVITASEAASIIGCSLRSVQDWQARGRTDRPQAQRIGWQWMFDRKEVEEYAEARKSRKK